MNIGIFTDTYYPQVSGVATSIKTLREQLEKQGHTAYIFTTTDPNVDKSIYERNIFRFSSIPFISFTDRRIAVRGLFHAYQVAKELNLDIIHTQTEFSMGLTGKFVAKNLKIPCIHTYHTMYEDYLHYVAKGRLLKPYHVKQMSKSFCYHMSGIVAPSLRVKETLERYGIDEPIEIIPTGVDISKFSKSTNENIREKYKINPEQPLLLTLSRLAFEKNIDKLLNAMPDILARVPETKLMICGDGPARESLVQQVSDMNLIDSVIFTGEINNDEVGGYYKAADVFVSTSVSESQGLTYIEAIASGTKVITTHSPYTDSILTDASIGMTFTGEDELVNKVVDYLLNGEKYNDSKPREELLNSISADNFGRKVVSFYEKCMLDFDMKKKLRFNSDELNKAKGR